jgi:hypothetical protein
MKPAAFTCALLLLAVTAGAQFTLLPQVGFDNSKTKMEVNDAQSFSPLGRTSDMKANLRLDYNFKTGHGLYAAIGSSPAVVKYSFTNPSDLAVNAKAVSGSLQWRVEGGYQFRSKAFKLGPSSSKSADRSAAKPEVKRTCGSWHSCGSARYHAPQQANLNLRLQPSLGVAYIPSAAETVSTDGTVAHYNAGNWKTAMVAGMGFEFGKGRDRFLTTTIYYTKGLSNLDTREVTTTVSGKPQTTTLRSSTNSWGMTIGVPFTLGKSSKPATKKTEQKSSPCKSRCGSYHSSCIKRI